MNTPEQSQLGKTSAYIDQYDASLLFPIPRSEKRVEIGITGTLPFMGADMWTAFELSWLNARGRPQVAIAQITIPCESPCIAESKSVKLYFNSFNNTRFAGSNHGADEVREAIALDIGTAVFGTPRGERRVGVRVISQEAFHDEKVQELDGVLLDRLDVECTHYQPAPQLLTAAFDEQPVSETLVSHLLKSNCLVTGQPDWGSVQIEYSGPQIDQAALLQYIVSFRNHNEFHEQCVERIYTDIWARCKPAKLAVYARYTRRGGVDINPFRTSHPQAMPLNIRSARQ
ncbi:NADPH-dependent 7-cyano-7-deazaguanine reductase QueF [Variovorax sp. PCZ-1]|uniref:NADPH-dependent 7-cyano-7-deazaguanine reductase QueF n=1 Tax=Variovorax sp. PCZ-1 TaxID=2835533 RepID=UPI001BCE6EC4|nr:NADPH-dependent 7-cyano-7-deazaguanine reductase QueF [Variovorax sp. PCZ-1]MBS7808456.1 NADPH-dependent 7-cyano-7-deazaguanine reductase QueF [Variovorax sp. PCZ-1]